MKPTITIIMATYNRAHFIQETLSSIQNQTFSDWECIIIDDGGTDNTEEIIQEVLQYDNRFQFHKRTEKYQKGLPGCRNYGLDLAKGNYIVFFDDDDIVHPQNLELCAKELKNDQFYFCRYLREAFVENFNYNFDYSKEYSSFVIDSKDVESLLKNELPFNSCAVMWRKECFTENRFFEHLMYAEEWELYSRILLSSGTRGVSINKCLFYGRKHPNSNTGEFYNNNPIRKASKKDAVLLVISNLNEKGFLTNSLIRYFIQMSLNFKEFNLFKNILYRAKMSKLEEIKWIVFYKSLPLRLFLHKFKKQLFKKQACF